LDIIPGVKHGFDQEWEMAKLTAAVDRWLESQPVDQ
jgi:hypothetical protein